MYRFFADCSAALTRQRGSLPGSTLSASTDHDGWAADARLNSSKGWKTKEEGQWLQVKLASATEITAIATQGYDRWTDRFLLYSSCDGEYWQPYGKVRGIFRSFLHVGLGLPCCSAIFDKVDVGPRDGHRGPRSVAMVQQSEPSHSPQTGQRLCDLDTPSAQLFE